MYERQVSRAVKRINYSKRSRDPPIASIGNAASPGISRPISRAYFINNLLPLAEMNGWIQYPKTNVTIQQYDISPPESGTVFEFPEEAHIISIYTSFSRDLSSGSCTVRITLTDNFVEDVTIATGAVSGNYYFSYSPNSGLLIPANNGPYALEQYNIGHGAFVKKLEIMQMSFRSDYNILCAGFTVETTKSATKPTKALYDISRKPK